MTNVLAVVAIVLVTNRETIYLNPAGQEKFVRTVISEVHSTTYTVGDRVFVLKATNDLSTNFCRMVWQEVPWKIPRQQLSVRDFPSPLNQPGVKREP